MFIAELVQASSDLLDLYRERDGDASFWAEPFNAITNASFLIAAIASLRFAVRKEAASIFTLVLICVVATIGCGSFFFHTVPNHVTMWLDIGPIALFQICFLWLFTRKMLEFPTWAAAAVVGGVVGTSFALMQFHDTLNGSLFYCPPLLALLGFGATWMERSKDEPYLLFSAGCTFALAIAARSMDWSVPWSIGTHFVWHSLNGVVIYLLLRTWIVFTVSEPDVEVDAATS